MPSPRVTVVVPNYNHAEFLKQRLDSILSQTFQDFEILYLDDASTDDSANVFAVYADNPRVRAIVNTQNTGSPFVQWNRGVREARGEYVWIAESDDFADPCLLETLVAKLDTYPNVGLAYCQSWLVDEHSRVLRSASAWTLPYKTTRWDTDYINSGRDECRRFLAINCTIFNASSVVFRKSVYMQAGGADESLRAAGDWHLYAKILLQSDIAFCAAPLNFFRQHTRSVISRSDLNGLNLQEAYQVVGFVVRHVNVDPQTLQASCRGRIGDWHRVMMSDQRCIPWQRSLAIYQAARRVDKLLLLRLVKMLIMMAVRKVTSAVRLPRRAVEANP